MKKLFQVRSIIKIPDKSFDDLCLDEVASMIEADSSISANGNDLFDSSALDVFLYNAKLSRPDLLQIREDLLLGIYVSVPSSRTKEIDTDFLRNFARELRQLGNGGN